MYGGTLAEPLDGFMSASIFALVGASAGIMGADGEVWLGGESGNGSSVWEWGASGSGDIFSDGSVAVDDAFTLWGPEPVLFDGNCLSLSGKLWAAADCLSLRHAVCEGTDQEMVDNLGNILDADSSVEALDTMPSYSVGVVIGMALLCICLACFCPRPRALERFGDNAYWTLVQLLPGIKTELAEDQRGNYTKVFLGGMQLPPTHELIAEDIAGLPDYGRKVRVGKGRFTKKAPELKAGESSLESITDLDESSVVVVEVRGKKASVAAPSMPKLKAGESSMAGLDEDSTV